MPAAARIATSLRLRALDARDRLRPGHDPRVPPRRLRGFVGDSDFIASGDEFLAHFRTLGGLTSGDDVLDVGCGIGRMARVLHSLPLRGNYVGIDVNADAIAWCAARYPPSFRFVHADVSNGMYNPDGRVAPAEYRFPLEDASVDFAFATSLFTHLLPGDGAHYLREMQRVLRPGGRLFATFYLGEPGGDEQLIRVAPEWVQAELPGAVLHRGVAKQDIAIVTKDPA